MDYSFHKWWSMGFSKYHSYKLWVNKTLDFHSFSFWTPPEISFKFGLSQHFSYFLIKPVTTLDHLTRPKTLIKSYFTLFVSVQLLLLLNGVPKINWLTNLCYFGYTLLLYLSVGVKKILDVLGIVKSLLMF